MSEPFLSYAEATRAGISRRRLQSAEFTRLMRDCYVPADVPLNHELLVRAALRTIPGANFACHNSAALLWRGIVPSTSLAHIGGVDARRSIRDQVSFHQYKHAPDIGRVRGIPVTSPAQTFFDMAAKLEFLDLLILGDSLIHKTRLTADGLRSAARDSPGRGGRLAREVAAACRDRVESPGETRTRLLLSGANFPEPAVNHPINDAEGNEVRRIDLAYPNWKIAIEYDGRHHIERQTQWTADIGRREELEADDWRFIVVTSSDIYPHPEGLLQRVADMIAQRSGVRPVIESGWRRYFVR
ncbi:DUF559 domain-containing protein [Yimella radicis]